MSTWLQPSQEAAVALMRRGIPGPVVMLNLLRFREVADYAATPDLAPESPISGEMAFRRYIDHTLPLLRANGGELLFMGHGGPFLIGPPGEGWDMVMLVRQASVEAFLGFAQDEAIIAGVGHRTAAIRDSRLLPMVAEAPPEEAAP